MVRQNIRVQIEGFILNAEQLRQFTALTEPDEHDPLEYYVLLGMDWIYDAYKNPLVVPPEKVWLHVEAGLIRGQRELATIGDRLRVAGRLEERRFTDSPRKTAAGRKILDEIGKIVEAYQASWLEQESAHHRGPQWHALVRTLTRLRREVIKNPLDFRQYQEQQSAKARAFGGEFNAHFRNVQNTERKKVRPLFARLDALMPPVPVLTHITNTRVQASSGTTHAEWYYQERPLTDKTLVTDPAYQMRWAQTLGFKRLNDDENHYPIIREVPWIVKRYNPRPWQPDPNPPADSAPEDQSPPQKGSLSNG